MLEIQFSLENALSMDNWKYSSPWRTPSLWITEVYRVEPLIDVKEYKVHQRWATRLLFLPKKTKTKNKNMADSSGSLIHEILSSQIFSFLFFFIGISFE